MIEVLQLSADVAIIAWLVFTWFFEGHHKRCKVDIEVTCKHCARDIEVEADCVHDRRSQQ